MVLNIRHGIKSATGSWPDASTTGPTGGLTAVPGSLTSGTGWVWQTSPDNHIETTATCTLSGLDVSGYVNINYPDSTITNCRFTFSTPGYPWVVGIMVGAHRTIVEYTEVLAPRAVATGHGFAVIAVDRANDCIIRYCDVSGGENGIDLSASGTHVTENYIHDMIPYLLAIDPHVDGIAMTGSVCDDTYIYHNNVVTNTDGNSAITMGNTAGITINNNRLIGGSYTVYLWYGNTVVFTNNRLDDWFYSYYTSNGGAGTPTISGNVDDSSGAAIP